MATKDRPYEEQRESLKDLISRQETRVKGIESWFRSTKLSTPTLQKQANKKRKTLNTVKVWLLDSRNRLKDMEKLHRATPKAEQPS